MPYSRPRHKTTNRITTEYETDKEKTKNAGGNISEWNCKNKMFRSRVIKRFLLAQHQMSFINLNVSTKFSIKETEIGRHPDRQNELYDVSEMLRISKHMWLRFYIFLNFCVFS